MRRTMRDPTKSQRAPCWEPGRAQDDRLCAGNSNTTADSRLGSAPSDRRADQDLVIRYAIGSAEGLGWL